MRTHRKYDAYDVPRDAARVCELVALPHLSAARIEPLDGSVFLDCVFQSGESIVPVALIEVALPMLERRESSPFVWPASIAQFLSHESAVAIEDALLPWVESEAFNRSVNSERLRFFGSTEQRAEFERARTLAFLGAAPYAEALRAAVPYVYAARYAAGVGVRVEDTRAANGAVVLSRVAGTVCATLGSQDGDELANRWFGTAIFGRSEPNPSVTIGAAEPAALHVDLSGKSGTPVHAAAPPPLRVLETFGLRLPAVEPKQLQLPFFEAAGGSAGRILIVVRDDAEQAPDADTDSASLLAARLRAEGFTVETAAATQADPAGFDLVHVHCAAYPEQALPAVRKARSLGVAVVITEAPGSRDAEGSWGTALVPQILRISQDETILEDHLRMMAARKLEAPGALLAQEPFAGYRDALRELRGLAPASVPAHAAPFLPESGQAAAPPAQGGYILVHAPVEPRANQFALVRGAAQCGLPIVVAGPEPDPWYAGQVRAYAGIGAFFVPEPSTPHELLGLYAGAKVYADAAWTRLSEGRIALARAAGCAIATPDPADHEAVAAALKSAWDAPPPAASIPQADPLTEVILAYSNCAPAGRNT